MKSYGQIAKPFNELLKKENFSWNEVAELVIQKLKEVMITAPVLEGIGAVLMQDGHPIAYISKVLSPKIDACPHKRENCWLCYLRLSNRNIICYLDTS